MTELVKVSVLKLRDTFHEIIKNTNNELIEKGAVPERDFIPEALRAERGYAPEGLCPESLPSPFIVSFIIKYSKEMETGLYIIDEVSVPAYNITFPHQSLIEIFGGAPCCNSCYNINCFDLVKTP